MVLCKNFSNDDLNLRIIISMTREWQLKVTTISEKKLEIQLEILEKHEYQVNNSKDVALNIIVKNNDRNQEDGSTNDEDNYLIKKFENLLRKESKKETIQKEAPIIKATCFKCGKRGHVKSECPALEKTNKVKSKKDKHPKKVYVAWDDNEISSYLDKDHANKAFMVSHH